MKKKLTFFEFLRVLTGKVYLLNTNTLEVHDLRKKTKHCWIPMIRDDHKMYLSEFQYKEILKKGYKGRKVNGCRWCMKSSDAG